MPFFSSNRILRNSGLSLGLSLLFFFSQSAGFAQSADLDFEETPLTLSDLTPEGRLVVSNLAVAMVPADVRSAASTGDYDAAISANVASILAFLESVVTSSARVTKVKTLPQFEAGGNTGSFGGLMGSLFYEGGALNWPLQFQNSYLYEIQRALYGQSGVPPANQALLPFLYSAYGFTNALYSSFYGDSVGDMLWPVYHFFAEAESAQLDPWQIEAFFDSIDSTSSVPASWSDLWTVLYMGNSKLSDAGFSDAPPPYEGLGLYVMEGAINDVWRDSSIAVSGSDSALQVVDPVVAEEVYNLQSYLAAIESAVRTSGGGSPSSYNITNVFEYSSPGSDAISEGEFGLSSIGVNLRESYGSLLTNRIPASIGAVNTNEIFALTNAAMAAMPNLTPVQTFIQDSLSPFDYQNVGTGPEIRIFQTFTHDGITIPGMSLDLSDTRLTLLRERCNWLARFSYGLLFLVLTILRIRSFLDYVVAGFSSIYGGEIEASSSAEGFDS